MNTSLPLDLFEKLDACVIIPTYNNEKTLKQVVEEVQLYTNRIIVVNDGSTDNTSEILKAFPDVDIVSYVKNKGKGYALRFGFKRAIERKFKYAITIDSDGQHFAKDIPVFLEKIENEGERLIIGSRNMDQEGIPGKSSFGNKFSNFWFWVETGYKMQDTQSGYRLYPLKFIEKTFFATRKYEFEIEVLVRAAWKGVKIDSVPVSVYYAPNGERVSHFRPFKDFSRISVLNTVLVTWTFTYIIPRNFIKSLFKKDTYLKLREELLNKDESTWKKALAIGFGIFWGIAPIWGFQLVVAIFLALVFRLNKWLVILAANISLPPMIPFIIYGSFKIGKYWVKQDSIDLIFHNGLTVESIKLNIVQYFSGAITLAFLGFCVFTIVSYLILSVLRKERAQ